MRVPSNALNKSERLQIGAFGLIKRAVLTSTSYNFNFHAPLFKEGGCIVNLIWLISGYSRYKDRLFALKNGLNRPFLMWRPFSEVIFRQSPNSHSRQIKNGSFPKQTPFRLGKLVYRNLLLFQFENYLSELCLKMACFQWMAHYVKQTST